MNRVSSFNGFAVMTASLGIAIYHHDDGHGRLQQQAGVLVAAVSSLTLSAVASHVSLFSQIDKSSEQ